MTIKFKAVIHKDGTGGLQTAQHYFDFGQDMKGLAQEVTRLLDGGGLNAAGDQPKARYQLTRHGHPTLQWYAMYPLSLIRRHTPDRREKALEECRFPNEKVFLSEFFKLNPPSVTSNRRNTGDRPSWANALDEERIRQGISTTELTEPFGVTSKSAVGHYLTGRRPMSVEQLIDVAAYLGMDPAPALREAYNEARKHLDKRKK